MIKCLDNFKSAKPGKGYPKKCEDWNHKLRGAASRFKLREGGKLKENYSYLEIIEHVGGMKTKCYLTGRKIDLEKDDFSLDHIVPVSKGGSNDLNNIGLTIPEANRMKSDLSKEDFISLYKEVLENNGFNVIAKNDDGREN